MPRPLTHLMEISLSTRIGFMERTYFSCMSRTSHTVFPPGHDYDLGQTTIPKHFVVKVRSGTDGGAVEIKYLVLKFAMDVANV